MIETILVQSIDAITKFKEKQFSAFDPPLGDELCEIRAYKIVLLSRENLTKELDSALEDCKAVI